jgi:hypothetical protein
MIHLSISFNPFLPLRTFNILVHIMLPLFVIIGLSFLFGFLLAKIESPVEINKNNDLLRKHAEEGFLSFSVREQYNICIDQFVELSPTTAGMSTFIKECTNQTNDVKITIQKYLNEEKDLEEHFNHVHQKMTYNWISCSLNEMNDEDQATNVIGHWLESFTERYNFYRDENMSENQAFEKAVLEADGSKDCAVSATKGSLFWFTVLTTVGYGNSSPTTVEGKFFVMIFGVMSIFAFTAITAQSAYVMLTIVDDFLCRVGMKRFTNGILAALFWFVILLLWIFLIAGVTHGLSTAFFSEFSEQLSFLDCIWFNVISITTVGFGDIYIFPRRDSFHFMFLLPLLVLFSFILYGNFYIKVGELIVSSLNSTRKELDDNIKSLRLSSLRKSELAEIANVDDYDRLGSQVSSQIKDQIPFDNMEENDSEKFSSKLNVDN